MMFEDKRIEKKLLHLKESYDKIETVSDSEKILYEILNNDENNKKKPGKKFPFTYVSSLAAVLLIGVFIGLSSLLENPSINNSVFDVANEGTANYDQSPASLDGTAELGKDDGGKYGIAGDEETNDEKFDKQKFIEEQEEEQEKYDEENKEYYEVFHEQISNLYDKASEMLNMSQDKLNELYSMKELKQIIVRDYRNSQKENKFDITQKRLESLIDNTTYFFGNVVFESMESQILESYNAYKDSGYDNEVLRGLEPVEVMALYLYANTVGDDEMEWELLNKSEPRYYPSKEEWLNDSNTTEETMQNRREFIESIYLMEQLIYTHESGIKSTLEYEYDSALIILHFSADFTNPESIRGFRLSTNDEGIWKVNFMPMQ